MRRSYAVILFDSRPPSLQGDAADLEPGTKGSTYYENVRHRRMPTWVETVDEMKNSHKLDSVAVYALDFKSYAHTISFKVSKSELDHISACLRDANDPHIYGNIRVSVAEKQYSIEPTEYSVERMKCVGPANFDDRNVWISKSSMYVVIGVCKTEISDDCLTAVSQLVGYIREVEKYLMKDKSKISRNRTKKKIRRTSIHNVKGYSINNDNSNGLDGIQLYGNVGAGTPVGVGTPV